MLEFSTKLLVQLVVCLRIEENIGHYCRKSVIYHFVSILDFKCNFSVPIGEIDPASQVRFVFPFPTSPCSLSAPGLNLLLTD